MADKQLRKSIVRRPIIEEFPQDRGCWWIRWVDGYRNPRTASSQPTVCVHLQHLNGNLRQTLQPEGALAVLNEPVTSSTPRTTAHVSVGVAPELTIGCIYRDGVRVGVLGNQHALFSFDLRAHPPTIARVGDTGLEPPSWWSEDYQYRVINRSEYHVPNLQSKCLLLRDPRRRLTLIVPCQEIFRFFYARESKLARALLTGPWATTMDRVVNTERTLVRPDGSWQVVLRNGMRNDSIQHAANLSLHNEGIRAAKGIYSSLMSSGTPWNMQAGIPFAPGRLRFTAKYLTLRDGEQLKLLCTGITSAEWPHEVPINHHRENDPREGEAQIDTDNSAPFTGYGVEVSSEDGWHMGNTSIEDPSARGPAVTHPSPGSGWQNKPPMNQMTKKESRRYRRRNPDPEGEALSQTSAGEPFHGGSTSTVGVFAQGGGGQEHIVNRFSEVIALFNQLLAVDCIKEWKSLPTEVPQRFMLEGETVWPLPYKIMNEKGALRKRPWAIVDKEAGRPRCALVGKLTLLDNRRLYWFEIEPTIVARETGNSREIRGRGFRSLILQSDLTGQSRFDMVSAALALCVRHRGIWPEPEELRNSTGADAATTWIHHHLGTGELSVNSACRAINEIAAFS